MYGGGFGRSDVSTLLAHDVDKKNDLPFGFSGRRVAGPPLDHLRAILWFSSPGISLAEVSKVPLNTSRMT
jgi:hypothetical protein